MEVRITLYPSVGGVCGKRPRNVDRTLRQHTASFIICAVLVWRLGAAGYGEGAKLGAFLRFMIGLHILLMLSGKKKGCLSLVTLLRA